MTKAININPLLDEIIRETGLTQEQLSEEIGYDRAYLSQARKAGTKKLHDKLMAFMDKYKEPNKSHLDMEHKQESRGLERAIENLSEADVINARAGEINARNIERLIGLLEIKLINAGQLPAPSFPPKGTPGTETLKKGKNHHIK